MIGKERDGVSGSRWRGGGSCINKKIVIARSRNHATGGRGGSETGRNALVCSEKPADRRKAWVPKKTIHTPARKRVSQVQDIGFLGKRGAEYNKKKVGGERGSFQEEKTSYSE